MDGVPAPAPLNQKFDYDMMIIGESSGSVVECLTRDEGLRVRASPASLHCVLEQDTFILA